MNIVLTLLIIGLILIIVGMVGHIVRQSISHKKQVDELEIICNDAIARMNYANKMAGFDKNQDRIN